MKLLTDELFELGKNSNEIFTPLNEQFCLVTKAMPVNDNEIDDYIANIRDAHSAGVNIARILDYRLIPGTTKTFYGGDYQFTKGVYLEERAPGNSIEYEALTLSLAKEHDFKKLSETYLNKNLWYIEELERRAEAPQGFYDKLVGDCLNLNTFGLAVDPRPLNFFFDPDVGFTIIDVLKDSRISKSMADRMIDSLLGIVYGYGSYDIVIDGNMFSYLPMEFIQRLINAYRKIDRKLISSLRKFKFSDDDISAALLDSTYKYENKNACASLDEVEGLLRQEFENVRKQKLLSL